MSSLEWFGRYFPLLTDGKSPFVWQWQLFEQLIAGEWPRHIDLPTGTGKTSLMTVWLIALAWKARALKCSFPRRMVWVVNRRVVVDQATREAEDLGCRLGKLPEFDELRRALSGIAASGELLAVSTLRGELADNGDWKADPSRAAIVIGTVDMIGSRLLFSGYGDGAYFRPQHAGLLAVDTVIVNDEAHLTVPFAKLLRNIEGRSPAEMISGKQFRFIEMSATHAGERQEEKFPESLKDDCEASEIFAGRFTTQKKLSLDLQPDSKRVEARIFELAISDGAARTIIFIDRPEKARDMCVRLAKQFSGERQVQLLTGTMRGQERDGLDLTLFGDQIQDQRFFLVATSAGEVGVDITAERVITGISEINRLIQRFGRLDRYGKGGGEAHVVFTAADLKENAVEKTLGYLQRLGASFSSQQLRENPPDPDAQEPPVRTAQLQDWLVELWCQTSDPVRDYPKVEDYLHGEQEENAETELAWRADVEILANAELVSSEDRKEALRVFPVLARERLREPTSRLTKKLEERAVQHPGAPALVRERDGSVSVATLQAIAGLDLSYCLVLLAPGCGGLEFGMLSTAKNANPSNDVADGPDPDRRERCRYYKTGNEIQSSLVGDQPPIGGGKEQFEIVLSEEDDETIRSLVYIRERSDPEKKRPYLLETHLEHVRDKARLIAEKLTPELADAFANAGAQHDSGKDRDLWQHCMGRCHGMVVAKSVRAPYPKGLNGYRHELGSLIDTDSEDELTLHLIAAHHGHARPHFKSSAGDGESIRGSEAAIRAAPARFARLTERYGPWGLAYLEALLKAADVWASKEGPEDNG